MQKIQDTARRLWQQMSWGQRGTLIGLSVVILGAIMFVFTWAGTPTYGVLFTNLSAADAGSITSQLDTAKVPYQLADSGTTVLIPTSMVDAQRIKLANLGLPQAGTVGFSLFDKQSLFQGDSFTEQINYTRALEGELTQTISQISGVQYARVNIVLPKESLFSSDQASPTASVLLKVPMGGLSSSQVAGIQHLVASAVQGLKSDAVTVVDSSGNIISGNSGSDASAVGLTALQAQARYASNMEAQLGAMLDTVVGPGHAVVKVNDILDFTSRDQTSTNYSPQSPTSSLASSHTILSNNAGAANAAGGIVGLGSNVPTYGITTTSTMPATNTQSLQDLSFAVPITTTHVVAAPGTLQRLTVAVVLDSVKSPAELTALRSAVTAAAGLNATRGDVLSITTVPFDTTIASSASKALASAQQRDLIISIVRWAALLIVPLVLLFLLRRILIPKRLREYDADDYPNVEVLEEPARALTAGKDLDALPPGPSRENREAIARMAKQRPELIAGVIGRWIDEDANGHR